MSTGTPANASIQDFVSRIEHAPFPCVGAKSALSQQGLSFVVAQDLRSGDDDRRIVKRLQTFASSAAADAVFVSAVVLFTATPPLDEVQFEQAMWQRLQAWHAIDAVDHQWDPSVSLDPASARFSFSLGGRGFYVIGLHPGASRLARRFACPALVFNLHSQFETLRADGRYEKLREAITERDIAYSGSRNRMLARHGESSEAGQYSGRQVDDSWHCPFSPKTTLPQIRRHDDAA